MSKSIMIRVSESFEKELKEIYRQYCIDHGNIMSFTEFTERFSLSLRLKRQGYL